MQAEKRQLPAGLYLVPTPIGNARDITLRALDVLANATVLAAEDTRTLRHLMEIHGLALNARKIIAWHDHSSDATRAHLVSLIAGGASLGYASDAGMPLISDPGFSLMRDVLAADLPATVLPGASAVPTALALSGLPAERFQFLGFPPTKKGEREALWAELRGAKLTTILFESAIRTPGTIGELVAFLGADRPAAICRELTKKFETALRGTLGQLAERLAVETVRGEVVLLIGRADQGEVVDVEGALKQAMTNMSIKDAARAVAEATGLPKRQVYQVALALKADHG